MVIRQTVIFGLLIGCAAPAWAQGAASPANDVAKPPSVVAQELHYPIRMMEGNLEVAIERAVDDILAQIRDVAPELPVLRGSSKARGTSLDGYGVVFYLEIPTIQTAVLEAFKQMMTPIAVRSSSTGQPLPLNSTSAGVIEKVEHSAVFQDSRKAYHTAVRESLVEAMLESVVLPIGNSSTITLWITSDDPSVSSEMLMSVKTADLEAFRAKQITREEMKAKITIRDF